MIKAAITPLGVVFLMFTACISPAQVSSSDTAVDEAIRRQGNTIVLRQKLADARTARDRKDLQAAAKLYDDAYQLAQNIGPASVPVENAQALSGLREVRMELARGAQYHGDFKEADVQVSRVLQVDPKNPDALAFQKANNQMIEDQRGHIPSPDAVARAGQVADDKTRSMELVQDGKLFYEMGKYDEAEAKLKQAVALYPESKAAAYYINLVREGRFNAAERLREIEVKKAIVEVQQAWVPPASRDDLPVPNPYGVRTNLIFTSKNRQTIVRKLGLIRMDTLSTPTDGLTLGEVIRNLSEEARKRDPEKRGINFLINPNAEGAGGAALAGAVNPTTGLPIPGAAAAPVEQVDINGVNIKVSPALSDLTLQEVLEVILKVADKPITYSIEDYGIVFSLKGRDAPVLETRIYKVDANTFRQGLESVGATTFGGTGGGGGTGGSTGGGSSSSSSSSGGGGGASSSINVPRVEVAGATSGGGGGGGGRGGGTGGGGGGATGGGLRFVTRTNSAEEISIAVRGFFTALGVSLDPAIAGNAGKNVFYNMPGNTLFVRATPADLDIIEKAIEVLNLAPYQVNIKARFVEVTQNDNKALGFSITMGNLLMNGGSIGMQPGTAPSYTGVPTAANPEGTFPGSALAGTATAVSPSDQILTSGLRNPSLGNPPVSTPTIATITGILTDPQFRVAINALEQRDGVDTLAAPEVTTISGRQAQFQVVDIQRIVTDVATTTTSSLTGVTGATGGLTTPAAGAAPTITYPTTDFALGPVLDVVPYVAADGFTVTMAIIPTVIEFIGYDNPGQFVPTAEAVSGGNIGIPITGVLPLPHFRLRQVSTSVTVWDGQTVVLGGLISDSVQRLKDSVPVLGDLPLVGRFFRSEGSASQKKNLIIFVTPMIIDPAGNRLHTPDEMPFAQTSFPVQSSAAMAK